ncbi:MAG TPA: sigma 54-interacting transcriptional regulator [Longimicrobium sp.]
MEKRVGVVQVSDSFEQVWPRLCATAGLAHVQLDTAEKDGGGAVCALVLAAGGRESDCLPLLARRAPGMPRVAVAGTETDYRLVKQLLAAGADEYFALPSDLGDLRRWLETQAAAAPPSPAAGGAEAPVDPFSTLLGTSPAIREALAAARQVSGFGAATLLITGETGTGKDLLAQAVHRASPRGAGPFVEVNCAALPGNLLEAEVFGYEKGAFTDAQMAKPGLFEAADGGTLFLDEVGDLPVELQGKLLRVLETKRVRRLGSLQERQVDVRVVAATHVNLAARVRAQQFREDLFYRLDVLSVCMAPLRERGEDALLLADHFARGFTREYALPYRGLPADVRDAILQHSWPGNVRELRNAVERAVVLGNGALTAAHLRLAPSPAAGAGGDDVLPFPATLADIQTAAARAAVAASNGNKSRAAEMLQVSRKGLYALLRNSIPTD